MAETVYSKGATPEDDSYKTVLFPHRRDGGVEVGVANPAGGDIDWTLEGSAGPEDTSEVPDWSAADVVATGAAVAADTCAGVNIAAASAAHRHYRLSVRAAASGTPGNYVVWAQDGQA